MILPQLPVMSGAVEEDMDKILWFLNELSNALLKVSVPKFTIDETSVDDRELVIGDTLTQTQQFITTLVRDIKKVL